MYSRLFAACLLGFGLVSCNKTETVDQRMNIPTPVAKKVPKELTIHGDTRIDPYYWLNERENPEVIAYLNAENAYVDTMMQHTKPFQDKLFNEMKSRIKEDDASVPYFLDGYFYYTRFEQGKEYPIYCRKKDSLDGTEEIMLNVNELAVGTSYCQASGVQVSTNNQIGAFAVDTVGRRIYNVYFKNLQTGEMLPDVIPNVTSNMTWANDNKTVFYTRQDAQTLRSFQIYRHILGTDPKTDKMIYEEKDVMFSCYVGRTKSKKFILISSAATNSSEVRFLEADKPEGNFKVFQPRRHRLEYSVDHFGDQFYVRTNDKGLNFRLVSTPLAKTEEANWQEVIAHREEVLLEDFEIFKDHLVVTERSEGLVKLRVIRWADKGEHYIDFGEPTYSAYVAYNPQFDTKVLRYGYQSLTTPSSTYDYDMESKAKNLLKQQPVLGDFKADNYQAERIYAVAKDGVKVPISLVYRKGTNKDGSAPMYLTGYGSYGATYDAYFSSVRLSLLDRGFVFAIAHIRGGSEMGRKWYEDGKMLNKKNTFTDFIACAEHLIAEKYTSSERLAINGGSAGGLLMGAVINLKPELFKVAVADVPFVDVVTTMLDESIPLTTGEFEEWGNPKDKQYYDYMKSYSPYDNVEKKAYPNLLVTTGLHDSQVQYWEPAKWVAKLRDMKTDKNILLFQTNMDAGHGGASGRFAPLKEVALEYAFIMDIFGIKE